ncbi:hypothetical protein GQ44DRAFT_780105 [Phaeosphaeriaceae sp. PMI808]|nr:hypothetical protein GQ44DRAFT_780105 [Phaeosphaeriaceae sp. PMI808]
MATIQGPSAKVNATAKREAERKATRTIKRRKTLIGEAHDFHKDCGFEVLLLLQKGPSRPYVYASPSMPSWHPFIEDLMRLLPSRQVNKLIQALDAKLSPPHGLHPNHPCNESHSMSGDIKGAMAFGSSVTRSRDVSVAWSRDVNVA